MESHELRECEAWIDRTTRISDIKGQFYMPFKPFHNYVTILLKISDPPRDVTPSKTSEVFKGEQKIETKRSSRPEREGEMTVLSNERRDRREQKNE